MPKTDKEIEVQFPVSGLNVATEFGRQPKATTPQAGNVRAFESLAGRGRGGSRPGLTPYIPPQLPSGDHIVQHMNIIVDPQAPALLAGADLEGDIVEDPRNPGTYVRSGGDGVQMHHGAARQPTGIRFAQKAGALLGTVGTVQTVVLGTNPNVGDLIEVTVVMNKSGLSTPGVASVRNDDGEDFTQVGNTGYTADATITIAATTFSYTMSKWYKVVAGVQDQTIKITPGGSAIMEYAIVVYRGAASGGPFTNKAKVEAVGAASTLTISGLLLNGTSGQLGLASIYKVSPALATIVTGGYVGRFGLGSTGSNIDVAENTQLSGAGPESYSETIVSPLAGGYIGIFSAYHK